MQPFDRLTAITMPLLRDNIDTDAIIPSREMRTVSKQGLADGLFAGWRYTQIGGRDPNPDFIMNDPAYAGAGILLGGGNFGCGSSREHAAWALVEYGFRAIIATSFNPIFRGNCVRNGIVPIELEAEAIGEIARQVVPDPQTQRVTVDLDRCVVEAPTGTCFSFLIEAEAREMLLGGLDAIDLTLARMAEIEGFRAQDAVRRPWIYL